MTDTQTAPRARRAKPTVTYFLNTGSTPARLEAVARFTHLREARAAAPTDGCWAIIRAEDWHYRAGHRSVAAAADDACRVVAEHMCADINRAIDARLTS